MAHDPSFQEQRASHVIPASRYYVVWVALLALTALTVIVGRIHLGHGYGLVVALVIAVVKATLVALFFMHLYDHGGANRLVLVTGVFFVVLLLGITLLDNATRFPLTNPPTEQNQRWQPPGPDILSPGVMGVGTTSRHEQSRDEPAQQHK